ncbi:diguanylate cyclase [Halomonas sp. CH40]
MEHQHDAICTASDSPLLYRYRAAFLQSREAIVFFKHGRIIDCNPATLALFAIPQDEDLATLDIERLSPATQPDGKLSKVQGANLIAQALESGRCFFEWCLKDLHGRQFSAEVMLYRLDLPDEGTLLQATVRDISEPKAQRIALLQREKDLLEAQRIARLGNWISDFNSGEIRWCEQIYQMFGRPFDERISHDIFMQAIHPEDRHAVQAAFDAALKGAPYDVIHRVVRPDGSIHTLHERGQVEFSPSGWALRMIGTVQDITEQQRLEDELARNAITDHLTGAYNRKRFDEEIEKTLARRRRNGVISALIMLDIDHFKPINDTHGHDVGDDVLVALTRLLSANLRVPDLLARWGGEEFVIILPDTDLLEARHLAERLRRLIAEHSFAVIGHLTASLGVTTLQPTDDPRSCMKRLDDALYKAKFAGRNQVVEAQPVMDN